MDRGIFQYPNFLLSRVFVSVISLRFLNARLETANSLLAFSITFYQKSTVPFVFRISAWDILQTPLT